MKKILIVDDEESIRKVIATTLMEQGYEALEAEDGIQGFDMAKGVKPERVLHGISLSNNTTKTLRVSNNKGSKPAFLDYQCKIH